MLTKTQKQKIVLQLAEILNNSESIVFTDFTGLSMAELTELKRDLKKDGLAYKVFKKSLLEKAFEKVPGKVLNLENHKSSIALAYAAVASDAAGLAKKIYAFAVKTKKLSILGGYLINEMRPAASVVEIAKLPPREVLLAQVLQLMLSPVSGLARVLDGIRQTR